MLKELNLKKKKKKKLIISTGFISILCEKMNKFDNINKVNKFIRLTLFFQFFTWELEIETKHLIFISKSLNVYG